MWGEYNPLIIQVFWHLARMECEEVRHVLREWTAEKQKIEHGLSLLTDMVLSPFRLKPGLLYLGKCSDHSATEWKRSRTISLSDFYSVFLNGLVYVLLWQEDSGLRLPVWQQYRLHTWHGSGLCATPGSKPVQVLGIATAEVQPSSVWECSCTSHPVSQNHK